MSPHFQDAADGGVGAWVIAQEDRQTPDPALVLSLRAVGSSHPELSHQHGQCHTNQVLKEAYEGTHW